MTKNDLKENPAKGVCWDLSDLYESLNDSKFEKDFKDTLAQAQKFEKNYRGKINSKSLDAETLLKVLQEAEGIYEDIMKPWLYARLLYWAYSSQTNNDLFQKLQKYYVEVEKHLLFFDSEWISLEDNLAEKLLADKILTKYHHFLENKQIYKPHQLSEPEEKIIREKSVTGIQAFGRLRFKTLNSICYSLNLDGKIKEISEKEILNLAKYHPSRELRRRAAKAFIKGLKTKDETFTFILNIVAQNKALEDKLRGYPSPLKERNLGNEVEDIFITRLLKAGEDNRDIVEKYYQLKGRILGIKHLKEYDIFAPLLPDSEISFEECKKTILETYNSFSPVMAGIAEKFFLKSWVDAEIRKEKYGGAFCESLTPSAHPYVLLNFTGKLTDVITAVHELGHGIDEYLGRSKTLFNVVPPPPESEHLIVLAETASLFGEILAFENLKKKVKDDKTRLGLTMRMIENSFAAFFRQIAFTRFELMVHKGVHKEGNLSTKKINHFWNSALQSMFGKALKLTKDYDYYWMYIGQFIRVPFYCYAYAFGFTVVTALYARWQEEGERFVPKYLKFLEAGRSMRPEEALKIVGIDLADPNFWQSGVDVLRNWVEEVERLAKSLGLV